ncbi:MAG: hypothetical protein ABSD73_05300 [Candidatus Bathyarchaeia archaeon]|jgi:hypothetical protein
MVISRVWEILRKFKLFCISLGWKTSEGEDWVELEDNYHNFLWARDVHPSSFRRIALDKKCVVREGTSYRVVEASYTAWLFSQTPSEELVRTICENPAVSKNVALYDLSQVTKGKDLCVRLNNTDSQVFQEFEKFLQSELKVRVEPFPPLSCRRVRVSSCEEAAVA